MILTTTSTTTLTQQHTSIEQPELFQMYDEPMRSVAAETKKLLTSKSRIASQSSLTTARTTNICDDDDHSSISTTDDIGNDDDSNSTCCRSSSTTGSSTPTNTISPSNSLTDDIPTALQQQQQPTVSDVPDNNTTVTGNHRSNEEDEITTEDTIVAVTEEEQPVAVRFVTETATTPHQDSKITVPRKSCIKDTSHESIPLRNNGWKNLPKLTQPNLTNKFERKTVVNRCHNKNNNSTSTASSSVHFGTIEIRSYDICVGNNPSVSYGTPISLDWDYTIELSNESLERYESIRSKTKRRNMRQMMMNYNYRKSILTLHWNVTDDELLQSEQAMNIIRSQRNLTRTFLPLSPLEDCMTSLVRKIQRRRTNKQQQRNNTNTATCIQQQDQFCCL